MPTTGLAWDNLAANIQLRPTPPQPRTKTLSPNLILASLLTTLNSSEAVKQMIYGAIVLTLAWTYAKISEGA